MSQENNSRPVKDFRVGTISGAVFRNEVQRDGHTEIRYSIKIQKQFRKKDDDQWQNTNYFFPEELPKLQLVTAKCFEYISLTKSKDLPEQTPV